jgi:hypothetical protein
VVKDRRSRRDAKKWLGGRLAYMADSLSDYVTGYVMSAELSHTLTNQTVVA